MVTVLCLTFVERQSLILVCASKAVEICFGVARSGKEVLLMDCSELKDQIKKLKAERKELVSARKTQKAVFKVCCFI